MSHFRTFLPPDVLERSRDRERRARQRRVGIFSKMLRPAWLERRDALVVALVLVSLWALLTYTKVIDNWFDRFNGARPDELHAADALSGR